MEGKGNAARDPVFHLERMIVEPQQHQQSPTGSAPDRVRPPAVAWYKLTVRNRTFPTRKLEMCKWSILRWSCLHIQGGGIVKLTC